MKFLRTIRFDESDESVFDAAAQPGEWAISGAFAFEHLTSADLAGKMKQAFANGFLGLGSFGRSTFTTVATITPEQIAEVEAVLAQHFLERYGAPDLPTAAAAAKEETGFILELCGAAPAGTVFMVRRSFDDNGQIREEYRMVDAKRAPATPSRIWEIADDE